MARTASATPLRSATLVLWEAWSACPPQFSGATKAKLRSPFDFRLRTAVPAIFRNSYAEKFLALPPPIKSRRLALSPAGLCRRTVSKILPVTSPDAIRSAAAATTAASELSTPGAGFLSPVSMTVTARHSVSSWDGAEVFRSIFIGIANLYFYHGDTESRRAQLRFSRAHDGLTGFFVSGATFLGLALVPELLALGKRDLALHAT